MAEATETFLAKYGASPFDPDDPNDVAGEAARVALIDAYAKVITEGRRAKGADREHEYVLGGLLVGIAQISAASIADGSDDAHAAIRASIMQVAPWAVDMMRAGLDLPPLPEA